MYPKQHDPVNAHLTASSFNPTPAALPRCTARQPPLTAALSPASDHAFIPIVTPSGDQAQSRLPGSGCCRTTTAAAAAARGSGNKYTPSRLPCPLISPNGRLHLHLGKPAGHPHSRRPTTAGPRAVAPPRHCGPPSRWVGARSLERARLRICSASRPSAASSKKLCMRQRGSGGMRHMQASLSSSLHAVYLQARRYFAAPCGAQRQPLVHPNAARGGCLTGDGHPANTNPTLCWHCRSVHVDSCTAVHHPRSLPCRRAPTSMQPTLSGAAHWYAEWGCSGLVCSMLICCQHLASRLLPPAINLRPWLIACIAPCPALLSPGSAHRRAECSQGLPAGPAGEWGGSGCPGRRRVDCACSRGLPGAGANFSVIGFLPW